MSSCFRFQKPGGKKQVAESIFPSSRIAARSVYEDNSLTARPTPPDLKLSPSSQNSPDHAVRRFSAKTPIVHSCCGRCRWGIALAAGGSPHASAAIWKRRAPPPFLQVKPTAPRTASSNAGTRLERIQKRERPRQTGRRNALGLIGFNRFMPSTTTIATNEYFDASEF